MAAFARREGLRYPTFASWAKKGGGRGLAQVSAGPVRFAEVGLPTKGPEESGLSVTLPDGLVLRGGRSGGVGGVGACVNVKELTRC